jgi:hypothetical protein
VSQIFLINKKAMPMNCFKVLDEKVLDKHGSINIISMSLWHTTLRKIFISVGEEKQK